MTPLEGQQDGWRLKHENCEERVRHWGLFSLWNRTAIFQFLREGYREDRAGLSAKERETKAVTSRGGAG